MPLPLQIMSYDYQKGFGNHFTTEAVPGTLPEHQNSPQVPPMGLYAEQLSGTAFTMPRNTNERSWLYRIRPSVGHSRFTDMKADMGTGFDHSNVEQMRWAPFELPKEGQGGVDFVSGMHAIMGSGDASTKSGICIYALTIDKSMPNSAFCNSDGDFLIVAQLGKLDVITEFGRLSIIPGEFCVIQRGIRFAINVTGPSRAYVLEIFDGHFVIPDLGPIGSNGLANPRDFETPFAWFEDRDCKFEVIQKFCGSLQSCEYDHSVFDVVAWHGNYAPYRYNLAHFNTMNSVSFDHPDPSIYTVLTCQSAIAGTAVADFVVFPSRWLAMEHSFRPPWFHRNCMTEFMGLIKGSYEAKDKGGFVPGNLFIELLLTIWNCLVLSFPFSFFV